MTLPEDTVAWAVSAFKDSKAPRYAMYRSYVEGDQPMEYATAKFRQAFGRLFDAFAYNRCATVVDAHADRLRVAGFGSDDTEQDDPIAQAAQDLWDRNHMDIHEGQLAVESFAFGDAYLIVETNPDNAAVYLWPQSAEQVRVHYDEDRPGVIDLAAKMWQDDDERMRLTVYYTDRIEKYRTVNRARQVPSSPKAFEPFQPESDTAWPIPLPLGDTVPVFHFPNNARINSYGVSELRDVIGLQDALNKSLMDQLVASEFAAAPQRVILGYDATDEESRVAMDNLVSGLTRMLAIPPGGEGEPSPSIAEFSAADMRQYDLVAEKWDIRISRVSKVPVHYLTQTGIAASGRALRIAEAPFVEKMTDRQMERGPVYANAITYALRLEGTAVETGDLRINWEPAAPISEEDKWDIAAAKASTGMPLVQILKEMGYEPDQIDTIVELLKAERAYAQGEALLAFDEFEPATPDAARRIKEEGGDV
jgi:hypothetical protein